jgi:catechol 2,3-dioxygenase-like lactoylglutathione lyase family enzyme
MALNNASQQTKKTVRGTVRSLALLASLTTGSQLQAHPQSLVGIAHVAFRVKDVPKSRDFYTALGFEQAFEFADAGKPPVSYIKINDRQFIELYGGASELQSGGLMHVCYEASDIQALWDDYVNRALKPSQSKNARAGNLLFTRRDPEGQLLEYTQYLPGSLHSEDRGKHLGAHRVTEHLLRATIPVKALHSERGFYTSKLGFVEISSTGAIRLRLPGNSREEVELEAAETSAPPSISFGVLNASAVEQELRSRGLTPQTKDGSVIVLDPDGVVVEFPERALRSAGKH